MRWPSQTVWLSRLERLSCPSSSVKMNGSTLDHVFCPSSERVVMSAALSTRHKAGLVGGVRRARRGRR